MNYKTIMLGSRLDGKKMLIRFTLMLSLLAVVLNEGIDDYRRSIHFINDSGRRFEVFWVSVNTGELVPQLSDPVSPGATASLNSFITHTFELREVPSSKTGGCSGDDNTCHSVRFTMNENHDQAVYLRKDWTVDHVDDTTRSKAEAVDLMTVCEARAKEAMSDDLAAEEATKTLDEFISCVKYSVVDRLKKASDEINYQAKRVLRKQ